MVDNKDKGLVRLFPTRLIDSHDLDDRLRSLEHWGGTKPFLNKSSYIQRPEYLGTEVNGTEVYTVGSASVNIPAGCVIDSEGRVVDLEALETEAFGRLLESLKPCTENFETNMNYNELIRIPEQEDSFHIQKEYRSKNNKYKEIYQREKSKIKSFHEVDNKYNDLFRESKKFPLMYIGLDGEEYATAEGLARANAEYRERTFKTFEVLIPLFPEYKIENLKFINKPKKDK